MAKILLVLALFWIFGVSLGLIFESHNNDDFNSEEEMKKYIREHSTVTVKDTLIGSIFYARDIRKINLKNTTLIYDHCSGKLEEDIFNKSKSNPLSKVLDCGSHIAGFVLGPLGGTALKNMNPTIKFAAAVIGISTGVAVGVYIGREKGYDKSGKISKLRSQKAWNQIFQPEVDARIQSIIDDRIGTKSEDLNALNNIDPTGATPVINAYKNKIREECKALEEYKKLTDKINNPSSTIPLIGETEEHSVVAKELSGVRNENKPERYYILDKGLGLSDIHLESKNKVNNHYKPYTTDKEESHSKKLNNVSISGKTNIGISQKLNFNKLDNINKKNIKSSLTIANDTI